MGGLGAEVSKNLMLSGLKSLTLMDDQEVFYGIQIGKKLQCLFKLYDTDTKMSVKY